MKTFDGKSLSKKYVQDILRRSNKTEIFHLCHKLYGGKSERSRVYDLVSTLAPTKTISSRAYDIAYVTERARIRSTYTEYEQENAMHIAMEGLRKFIHDPSSPYAKRPVEGKKHLWFCSPVFGHSDYNKWRSLPVAGNEMFCRIICSVADKYDTTL